MLPSERGNTNVMFVYSDAASAVEHSINMSKIALSEIIATVSFEMQSMNNELGVSR